MFSQDLQQQAQDATVVSSAVSQNPPSESSPGSPNCLQSLGSQGAQESHPPSMTSAPLSGTGLSSSWHVSSQPSEPLVSEGHGGSLAASWHAADSSGIPYSGPPYSSGTSRDVSRSSSMNGRAVSGTSTSGRVPGDSQRGGVQEAFVGWPRAVVVHSELRNEVGFAGTIHEVWLKGLHELWSRGL